MKSPRGIPKSPRKERAPPGEDKDDSAQLRDHLAKFLQSEPSPEDLAMLRNGSTVGSGAAPVAGPVSALVVDRLCHEIDKRGFSHGIFRVPGAGFKTRALVVALSHLRTGEEVLFKSEPNVHNVAAALTLYLSRTEPIIPYSSYATVLACVQVNVCPGSGKRRFRLVLTSFPI